MADYVDPTQIDPHQLVFVKHSDLGPLDAPIVEQVRRDIDAYDQMREKARGYDAILNIMRGTLSPESKLGWIQGVLDERDPGKCSNVGSIYEDEIVDLVCTKQADHDGRHEDPTFGEWGVIER